MALSLCGQAYHVGDLYTAPNGSKGIVFFVLPDGSGGWVVALNDASTGCKWGDAIDVPEIPDLMYGILNYQQANFDTAGYQKTALIRAFQNNSQTYAAGKVDFANGWYLPSPAQLSILFAQRPIIDAAIINAGGTLMAYDWYWTCSESDYQNACAVHFGNAGTNGRGDFRFNQNKSVNCRVRAVRSFSYGYEPVPLSYQWSTGATTPDITVSPSQTTTYTVTVSASNGCADTVSHTVVVYSRDTLTFDQTACEEFEWQGQTYTTSGDYTFTYPRPGGCDSVVILHLTVDHTPQATISVSADAICSGEEVTLEAKIPHVEVGYILCTDNSFVKPADYASSGKVAKGVVFYVDNSGGHGWAIHLHDQASGMQWGGYGTDNPSLDNFTQANEAITDCDGLANTQLLRDAGDATVYPAAWAVDYDNGWYLPAAGQLRLMLTEIVTLNASLQAAGGTVFSMNTLFNYWSSTEYGSSTAWRMLHTGFVIGTSKTTESGVRSVRNF